MDSLSQYRGRLAPSPTGRLHVGLARTALLAWLCARSRGGVLVMRVEDLDPPRVRPGAAEAIDAELRWLGLDWDEGPGQGGDCGPYVQSQRTPHYQAALERLRAAGVLFECSCSRREVAEASSAPHGELGPRYPGSCREGVRVPGRPPCLRFRMDRPGPAFVDAVHGLMSPTEPDDFIVRRADGLFAYQLAVVVDDIAMGITEVVRGADLLLSTPRQLALYAALGAEPPSYVHVPLVLGPDGQRLAKRHGSLAIADYRDAGYSAQRVVGLLAQSLGLAPDGAQIAARDLVADFRPERLSTQPTVWTHSPQAAPG